MPINMHMCFFCGGACLLYCYAFLDSLRRCRQKNRNQTNQTLMCFPPPSGEWLMQNWPKRYDVDLCVEWYVQQCLKLRLQDGNYSIQSMILHLGERFENRNHWNQCVDSNDLSVWLSVILQHFTACLMFIFLGGVWFKNYTPQNQHGT